MFFFFLIIRQPPRSTRTYTLFPYTTLFRSNFLKFSHLTGHVIWVLDRGTRKSIIIKYLRDCPVMLHFVSGARVRLVAYFFTEFARPTVGGIGSPAIFLCIRHSFVSSYVTLQKGTVLTSGRDFRTNHMDLHSIVRQIPKMRQTECRERSYHY